MPRERQSDDEIAFDIEVCDTEGRLLVRVTDYRLRRLSARDRSADQNFAVTIGTQGLLDTLTLTPTERRAPAADEIEIAVIAAGLNFIEVLYALGMLPERKGAQFGIECAGRVVRVGSGVTAFVVGDAVIAYTAAAFSRYATVNKAQVAHKPPHLSFAEAATIPAAFTTAYFSLMTQGRLAKGEKVLIHAASGGVGMAAVQIAQWVGAEVFGTAGSAEKRAFVRSLGVEHVSDSRSLSFVGDFHAVTDGVDLVLNSLGGDFINKNLELLLPYGRFIELGKRDLLNNTPLDLHHLVRSLSFIAVDVSPSMPRFGDVWREMTALFHEGVLQPLPQKTFPIAELEQAMTFMAQAKHIGKVVLLIGDDLSPRPTTRKLDEILGRQTATIVQPVEPASQNGYARPELATAYAPATNPTEAAIVAIWQNLLGIERIGIHDDFFDLRGDSLLATQVISHVHQRLNHKLPLGALFDAPTVAGLAALIAEDEMEEGEI